VSERGECGWLQHVCNECKTAGDGYLFCRFVFCPCDRYLKALDSFSKGDACIIFTPDDTHFAIALAAIERGLHVLIAKPMVKTLDQHRKLLTAARAKGVLVMCEVHKRFDPIYTDARDRIQNLGNFSYINAYMSQPKKQLETFRAWAGKSSDIRCVLQVCMRCCATTTLISHIETHQLLPQRTSHRLS